MAASFYSPHFYIGQIRIGSVEGASCVNLGNNYPSGFSSQKKHNQGFGSVSGDGNRLSGTHASLDDADVVDVFAPQPGDPQSVKLAADVREAATLRGRG